MFGLAEMGMIGIILLIIIAFLIPIILVFIVGIGFANILGFTGITWWAFVILFYLVISALLTSIGI